MANAGRRAETGKTVWTGLGKEAFKDLEEKKETSACPECLAVTGSGSKGKWGRLALQEKTANLGSQECPANPSSDLRDRPARRGRLGFPARSAPRGIKDL